jgi:hypothetical protein
MAISAAKSAIIFGWLSALDPGSMGLVCRRITKSNTRPPWTPIASRRWRTAGQSKKTILATANPSRREVDAGVKALEPADHLVGWTG